MIAAYFSARAFELCLALLVAVPFGWAITRLLGTHAVRHGLSQLATSLGRRLNKRQRDVATLVWRGVIVTALFFVPALVMGALLDRLLGPWRWLVPMAIFSFAFEMGPMLKLWRQARNGALPLSISRPHYLFPDQHAVLRYRILTHSRQFATGVVGVAWWYLLLGNAGALAYLALALAASHYATEHEENRAFGGVAVQGFALADALPRGLAGLFLSLAALVIPGTAPRHALARLGQRWHAFLAALLRISLGGPIPLAQRHYLLDWAGDGTPMLDASHLTRWLLLWLVALAWLIMGLAGIIALSYL